MFQQLFFFCETEPRPNSVNKLSACLMVACVSSGEDMMAWWFEWERRKARPNISPFMEPKNPPINDFELNKIRRGSKIGKMFGQAGRL